MISRKKFLGLETDKQIYKIANSIRECEKNPDETNYSRLDNYIDFFKDAPISDQSLKAGKIMKNYLGTGNRELRKLNFCFHELMGLLDKEVKEENFIIHLFDGKSDKIIFDTVVVLDNIRSPFNVGSIFRSSDCLGVRELFLCGITPTPESFKVRKTSMDSSGLTEWKYYENTKDAIVDLKKSGYRIVAVETMEKAVPLYDLTVSGKDAFIFGNEEFGISTEIFGLCDEFVGIPLIGKKNSLNVSNAFSITAYEIMKKNFLRKT
jgi:tRNA(Leu) C34 or U34 (ribose-2'-O)-methylase TrmL